MKYKFSFFDFMIVIYGIIGWSILAWFIWSAYLHGGSLGILMFRFNRHKEMYVELIVINLVIVIMAIYLLIKVI